MTLSDLLRGRDELVGVIALVVVQVADERGGSAHVVISKHRLMLLIRLQVIHQEFLALRACLR